MSETEMCANCSRTIGNLETRYLYNGNVVCGECDGKLRTPKQENITSPDVARAQNNPANETVLLNCRRAMFKDRPVLFILLLVSLIGLPFLGVWWLRCWASRLTVTNVRTTIRDGIFAKHTNEVRHKDARNIKVDQSLLQRIFGVGTLQVSSAGQSDIEIKFPGLSSPQKVAGLIRQYQG